MKTTLRQYLLVLGLGCGIAVLLSGCKKESGQKPAPPPSPPPAAPVQNTDSSFSGEGYTFVFPPEQTPRVWAISAKSFTGSTETGALTLTGVRGTLYRKETPALTVEATHGTATVVNKVARLSLDGNVTVVQASSGYRLQAKTFEWSSDTGLITAIAPRWQGEGLVHRADRGTFTTDLKTATFTGRVTTETVKGK